MAGKTVADNVWPWWWRDGVPVESAGHSTLGPSCLETVNRNAPSLELTDQRSVVMTTVDQRPPAAPPPAAAGSHRRFVLPSSATRAILKTNQLERAAGAELLTSVKSPVPQHGQLGHWQKCEHRGCSRRRWRRRWRHRRWAQVRWVDWRPAGVPIAPAPTPLRPGRGATFVHRCPPLGGSSWVCAWRVPIRVVDADGSTTIHHLSFILDCTSGHRHPPRCSSRPAAPSTYHALLPRPRHNGPWLYLILRHVSPAVLRGQPGQPSRRHHTAPPAPQRAQACSRRGQPHHRPPHPCAAAGRRC